MAKDKRQYPRVEISWPATIITADGCSESPGSLDSFRLVLKPAERQLILATAEKVWSKSFDSNNGISHAMGVRFTFIPDHDYQLIKGTVSKHT
jgi:hypothetical protein